LYFMDVARLADGLHMTWEEFWERYADRRWPAERSYLLKHENAGCPFLNRSSPNGDVLCGTHSFKPTSCRDWMSSLYRRDCQTGLAKRWGVVNQQKWDTLKPRSRQRSTVSICEEIANNIDSSAGI
jgi:Fe-S-cluster containining protein